MVDMEDFLRNEAKDLHQYVRDIFRFESSWHFGVWTLNGIAMGWLFIKRPLPAEELAVAIVFVLVNVGAIAGATFAGRKFTAAADRIESIYKVS